MSGTIIDTNVLIDIADSNAPWHDWSADAFLLALARGPVVINPIVYSELAVPYTDQATLDEHLSPEIEHRALPWAAAFLAGGALREHRRRGGTRSVPLPDFYIGAHAAVEQLDVLTRDPRRITSYFPTVTVISPPG
jgi:predicted nucleic acid-binding protein